MKALAALAVITYLTGTAVWAIGGAWAATLADWPGWMWLWLVIGAAYLIVGGHYVREILRMVRRSSL